MPLAQAGMSSSPKAAKRPRGAASSSLFHLNIFSWTGSQKDIESDNAEAIKEDGKQTGGPGKGGSPGTSAVEALGHEEVKRKGRKCSDQDEEEKEEAEEEADLRSAPVPQAPQVTNDPKDMAQPATSRSACREPDVFVCYDLGVGLPAPQAPIRLRLSQSRSDGHEGSNPGSASAGKGTRRTEP